ncbi:MAG: hypothetical protein KDE06_10175 [Rhodobacteraceae bacterium]|nr:hypothetical protein [Paracoccaceae bacterium]MCB2151478.1 hypothetical protein [Paracoccaceae bacterium]
MLISTSHRFIFVHIPKTAGTSITAALVKFCPPRASRAMHLLAKLYPLRVSPGRAIMSMHSTALQISEKIGPGLTD